MEFIFNAFVLWLVCISGFILGYIVSKMEN
jgi:hypothetical protein